MSEKLLSAERLASIRGKFEGMAKAEDAGAAVTATKAGHAALRLFGHIDALAAENLELNQLFDMQWKRTGEVTALWRAEAPAERELILPDLGKLLTWLMSQLAAAQHRATEMEKERDEVRRNALQAISDDQARYGEEIGRLMRESDDFKHRATMAEAALADILRFQRLSTEERLLVSKAAFDTAILKARATLPAPAIPTEAVAE